MKTILIDEDVIQDIERRKENAKSIHDRENVEGGHKRLKNENYGKYVAYSHCLRILKGKR